MFRLFSVLILLPFLIVSCNLRPDDKGVKINSFSYDGDMNSAANMEQRILEDGTTDLVITIVDTTGASDDVTTVHTVIDKDGMVIKSYKELNGLKHGVYKEFEGNEQVVFEQQYEHGKPVGEPVYYK